MPIDRLLKVFVSLIRFFCVLIVTLNMIYFVLAAPRFFRGKNDERDAYTQSRLVS